MKHPCSCIIANDSHFGDGEGEIDARSRTAGRNSTTTNIKPEE
jgi:hypothetical protein